MRIPQTPPYAASSADGEDGAAAGERFPLPIADCDGAPPAGARTDAASDGGDHDHAHVPHFDLSADDNALHKRFFVQVDECS